MEMNEYKELKKKIQKEIPALMRIEVGQIFHSKYYGYIVATRIEQVSKGVYSIYGFDIKEGFPRDNYYPIDLELVGKEPMLNDVLYYANLKGLYIYNIVFSSPNILYISEPFNPENYMELYLSKPYLKDQSDELIKWLNEL